MAWHDGKGKKLSGDFIWAWHLNREGSYSVSYLVESLAFTKWLQTCFGDTTLAGLSQGGAAVLLNALQSEPDRAIVASGFSVIKELAQWSGPGSLMGVPGYGSLSTADSLVRRLEDSSTRWLFSWGREERGTYKIDAHEQLTAGFISHLSNVVTLIHDEGHVFPVQAIRSFVDNTPAHTKSSKVKK